MQAWDVRISWTVEFSVSIGVPKKVWGWPNSTNVW